VKRGRGTALASGAASSARERSGARWSAEERERGGEHAAWAGGKLGRARGQFGPSARGKRSRQGGGRGRGELGFGPDPGMLSLFLVFFKAFSKRILRTIKYKPKAINTK